MTYSNCKWCGSPLPEKARKCENCDKPVELEITPAPARAPAPPKPANQQGQRIRNKPAQKRQSSLIASGLKRVFGLFLLLILFFAASSYFKYIRQKEATEAPPAVQSVETIPMPVEALKSPDPQIRITACQTLFKMKPVTPEVVNALIGMLKDPDANVRQTCNHFAGELGYHAAPAIPVLIENLTDEALNVRITAADALGAIASETEDARVIQALIAAMGDPEPFVRRSACWSLKGLGMRADPALPAFQKGADDSSEDVRKCSMDALADLSQTSLDITPFVKALQNDQANVRYTAAEALAKAGPGARRAIPALTPLLNDPDESVREAVVSALGKCCIETGETISLLNQALLDPSHSVRKHAVLHLGEMGPKARSAVPNLIKILSGQEIYLRVWAAQALGNIGPDAMPALTRLREMQNERVVSNEIEAAQLPGTVTEAIHKIEAR